MLGNSRSLSRLATANAIFGGASFALLGFLVLHKQSSDWRAFLEHFSGVSPLRFLFFASLSAFIGASLFLFRATPQRGGEGDGGRYAFLAAVVLLGLGARLSPVNLLITAYAALMALFFGRDPESVGLYRWLRARLRRAADLLPAALFSADSRTPALLLVPLFILTPLLMALGKKSAAENCATSAFWIMTVAVILHFVQLRRGVEPRNLFVETFFDGKDASRPVAGEGWKDVLRGSFRVVVSVLPGKGLLTGFATWALLILSALAAKHVYWGEIERIMAERPEFSSEISFLSQGELASFPSDLETIRLPLLITHPLSRPTRWKKSRVSIALRWFPAGGSDDPRAFLFEDLQPLPKSLIAGESVKIDAILKRPPLPPGGVYEVLAGLSFDGDWRSPSDMKAASIRVKIREFSGRRSITAAQAAYGNLSQKLQDVWAHRKGARRGKLKVIDGCGFFNGRLDVLLENAGDVPWPAAGQRPVRLRLRWMKAGEGSPVAVHERFFPLSRTLFPGAAQVVEVPFDPAGAFDADEIRLELFQEGAEWRDASLRIKKPFPDIFGANDSLLKEFISDAPERDGERSPTGFEFRVVEGGAESFQSDVWRGLNLQLELNNRDSSEASFLKAPVLSAQWFRDSDGQSGPLVTDERISFPGFSGPHLVTLGRGLSPGFYEVRIYAVPEESRGWGKPLKLKVAVD